MRLLLAAAGLATALAGCTPVGRLTAADATQAAAVAQAAGDSAVVPCFDGLAAVASASASVAKPGLLTGIEEKRAAKTALENPACAPLYAGALADLLKTTALAPLVP